MKNVIPLKLTFDDVLLEPRYSKVKSRREVKVDTFLTKDIKLNIPVISAGMDSVTESRMAITMARLGGLGVIHRFIPPEVQASEVKKVKRSESFIIDNPITISPKSSLLEAKTLGEENNISGILVVDPSPLAKGDRVDGKNKLLGIITKRDVAYQPKEYDKRPVFNFMTKKLITASPGINIEKAKEILNKHKIEKLPLVDKNGVLCGLITLSDIIKKEKYSQSSTDKKGRLLAAAAVGVKDGEMLRAEMLVKAGVDILVLDIAHGHSVLAITMLKKIKKAFPGIPVIAGNVATAEAVANLIRAGADGIRVGIGAGSICITRIITGVGVPQISAIFDCFKRAKKTNIPLIADGGIRSSSDIAKAMAAGASSVMVGSLLAGTDESPGLIITKDGIKYKISRGMASLSANLSQQKSYSQDKISQEDIERIIPEGVEAMVHYKGKAKDIVLQLVGGLKSTLSYLGAKNIQEMRAKAKFIRITPSGLKESYPHDVIEF